MAVDRPAYSDQPEHGHEHDWRLREVDYEDTLEVREYRCAVCELTTYR